METITLIENPNKSKNNNSPRWILILLLLLSLIVSFVALVIAIRVESQNIELKKQIAELIKLKSEPQTSMSTDKPVQDKTLIQFKDSMIKNQTIFFNNLTNFVEKELVNATNHYQARISKLDSKQIVLEHNISFLTSSIDLLNKSTTDVSNSTAITQQFLGLLNVSVHKLHEGMLGLANKANISALRAQNTSTLVDQLQNATLSTTYSIQKLKNKTTKLVSDFNQLQTRLCQRNGLVYEGKCYRLAYIRGPSLNYTQAKGMCKQQGGVLADVDDNKMLKSIAKMVQLTWIGDSRYWATTHLEIWLGLRYQKGTVVLSNGTPSNVTQWYPGYPKINKPTYTWISLYVGIEPGTLNKTGIYNNFPGDPHQVPLCRFGLK